MKTFGIKLFLCIIACMALTQARGYNLRHISNLMGLSNSAILSMCQDQNNMMWFGSCDGINAFDGISVRPYLPADCDNELSGNLIAQVLCTPDNQLWIITDNGLNKLNLKTNRVEYFPRFVGKYPACENSEGELFLINQDNRLHYYSKADKTFRAIPLRCPPVSQILCLFFDSRDRLWIVIAGESICYALKKNGTALSCVPVRRNTYRKPLLNCFAERDNLYLVDGNGILFQYDMLHDRTTYIKDVSDLINERGNISCIKSDEQNYFIGFQTDGLVKLTWQPQLKEKYIPEDIDIHAGIFCIRKDRRQNVIWIGTDGDGVYMYREDDYSIRSFDYSNYLPQLSKPVRAIMKDREGDLWIGTKGDGVARIRQFDNRITSRSRIDYFTDTNSRLLDNSVYAFARSKRNILWIGNDRGLNYYSFRSGQISTLSIPSGQPDIRYVHDILETDDSTLWIASVGDGIYKVKLEGTADVPAIRSVQQFIYNKDNIARNYFFTIFAENSSSVWFGNRGYGLFRYDGKRIDPHPLKLSTGLHDLTSDDIYAIVKDDRRNMWFGTGAGLIKRTSGGQQTTFNEQYGFTNGMIHGILKGSGPYIWLSTNRGIIRFNTHNNTYTTFDQDNGLSIIEFCDGASYRDDTDNTLYFGGNNGFITIKEETKDHASSYMPPVILTDLTVLGNPVNLPDFETAENGRKGIRLKYDQNFFTISACAIDYMEGQDYTYLYRLKGLNKDWISNGHNRQFTFSNLMPGDYTLEIKYYNPTNGKESAVYYFPLRILPPWYLSGWAYAFYTLCVTGLSCAGIRHLKKRNRQRKERLLQQIAQKHQKELYESKLTFFTNIAHEFCTPLTLIYGPCNRILHNLNLDTKTKKYALLIQRNAEMLNSLIQELIMFRKIDSGIRKPRIETLDIENIISKDTIAFIESADSRHIVFEKEIKKSLKWNSDRFFIHTITVNLLSNAFKYTNDNGKVSIHVYEENGLHLVVTNTGKGIATENLAKVFDRYSILDNFEHTNGRRFSRNGIGLAILQSMTKALDGTISVESKQNEWTRFHVILPRKQVETAEETPVAYANPELSTETQPQTETTKDKNEDREFAPDKPTILIIDDEKEMLWFISDLFVDDFNVITVQNPLDTRKTLQETIPDIIICDVMMAGTDGIALTRQLKDSPESAHIPLILLSARHEIEEQTRGLKAGAEMYITKPFNVDYLKASVNQLINRKKVLKTYFNSPLSAYELTESKLTHKEDKKFIHTILEIINNNLSRKELTTRFIAEQMNMSTRHLYRRLNDIGEVNTPSDMIKKCRLHAAKDMLINTKQTIDEIIYQSGFTSRSVFFKGFTEEYGCTPKEFRDKNRKD